MAEAAAPAATDRLGPRIVVPAIIFSVLIAFPVMADLANASWLMTLATRMMIFAIAVVSLDLILGYGAMVSFGHAAFVGIGAYAVGILASHGMNDAALSFPVAIVAAALFAAVTGAICLRTRGVYFIMITLAFGQMAFFTATSLSAYGGDDGLTLWTRNTLFGTGLFADRLIFYYVVLAVLLAAYLICRSIVGSRFGRVLRGCKENERRMIAMGADPFRFRLVAYVIAGMIAGVSGALLANHAEFVSPAYMTWQRSGEFIIMAVLGGIGTLHGAILGAAAFLALEEILSHWTIHWRMIFGPLLILIVYFAPGGLSALLRSIGRND